MLQKRVNNGKMIYLLLYIYFPDCDIWILGYTLPTMPQNGGQYIVLKDFIYLLQILCNTAMYAAINIGILWYMYAYFVISEVDH